MIHRYYRIPLGCILLLAMALSARGQLVLTNFSAANPMKIMAMGDSITDDCVFNGAWRQYLQTLLEADGFPFTFVGRQSSTPTGNFSKTLHEGYCGAVISPPGLVAGPVHGYAGFNVNLQRIATDALTITNPDLLLVYIGANDIGNGLNPTNVATNNFSKFLNQVFVKSPNSKVILVKTSNLQNGTVLNDTNSSLLYGAYATNVPIYNAILQSVVNQRQALGQSVYLADMFSAIDYNTMFNADHVHPNTNGLQAAAQEWLTRIEAITVRTNRLTSTLIHGGDNWKYSDAGQDLGTNWTQIDYADQNWSNGIARLGYGDATVATTVSFGADANNKYPTTYFRHAFVVPANAAITNLNFRFAGADGAVVWLNGREAFRTNLPAGQIIYTNLALSAVTGFTNYIFQPFNLAVPNLLPAGTNLVAVELHKSSVTNAALGFDMELIGMGYPIPPISLSIAQAGESRLLTWPATNAVGYTLYSTTNLGSTGGWNVANASFQTNNGQVVATLPPDPATRFFRLQRP